MAAVRVEETQHNNEEKMKEVTKKSFWLRKCNIESKRNHLHLPLFDVGWLSIATEESFVVRPHQARERTQQQLEEDEENISVLKLANRWQGSDWWVFVIQTLLWVRQTNDWTGLSTSRQCYYISHTRIFRFNTIKVLFLHPIWCLSENDEKCETWDTVTIMTLWQ